LFSKNRCLLEIYFGHTAFSSNKPVVTIGMFDGVHRGHISLLDHLVKKAADKGVESVVMTFDPHPRIVLSGNDSSLRFLTSLDEKTGLIEKAGIDKLIVIPFSLELSRMPASDFIRKYLVDILGIGHLIMGFDHHFGYRGNGNGSDISEYAARFGFGIDRLQALKQNGKTVSSTFIRELLSSGSLDEANSLLGYPYLLKGSVVEGKKIGRLLGYPTANITPDYSYKLIPADGVYAVEVFLGTEKYKAMLYIGPRPTIEKAGGKKTIEVNIFDFNEDIYGKEITVRFIYRLRGDRKFKSRDQLLRQINNDKAEALRLLSV